MPRDAVTAYAQSVATGKVLAGPHVRAACARHLKDLDTAADRGWRFDVKRAARAFDFFRDVLRLTAGHFEAAPFELLPWQCFVVGSLFGWIGADGFRRFRVAYVETGKGSGKSPLAGGIGLYMLVADGEARAEIYAAASKKEQAQILFRDAVAMVDLSPSLATRVRKTGRTPVWNLSFADSFFRPIASDEGQSGPRPHCGLIDELHEHHDDNVLEMMRAGFKGRRQPLLFVITNSGVDRQTVAWRYHDKACKVAAGVVDDDRFFSYVCALDKGNDPLHDEACWPKTNPSLGVSIQPAYLRDQVREALQMPAKESVVRRLHFCEWVDAASPWISGEAWRACEVEPAGELDEVIRGRDVVLAVDLSKSTDLTALAITWEDEPPELHAAVEFWTPADTMRARGERDGVDFELWAKQGHIRAVPGEVLDYAPIAERIGEIATIANVRQVLFDRWRIGYLKAAMADIDLSVPLVEHPQGFVKVRETGLWMPQSVTELEGAILRRELRVRRNPVLTWNAASAVTEQDAHLSRILSKRKSTGRIDGVVSLAMCVGARRVPAVAFDAEAMIG
jgi:phage terminase large subunit-like protein